MAKKNFARVLAALNPEQLAVVNHVRGPLLVGAVAGAGKTTALVARIANLIENHDANPERILAVTFSKKAADEMNARLGGMIGFNTGARVGTFHSLGFQVVREEALCPGYRVDERDRYRRLIQTALGYQGMKWDGADLTVILSFISRAKASCVLPGTPEAEAFAKEFHAANPCGQRTPSLLCEIYSRAEVLRHEAGLMTFDDMLLDAWRLFSSDDNARARWAARWDYVMQDESQDENLVQRAIATMMAKDHRNYMVVGDPAQSIYGFRGSDPRGLLAFASTWGAQSVHMHRNYRSGDSIIAAANGVLASMPMDTRLDMTITAERGLSGDVTARRYANMDEEADGVVEEILSLGTDGALWSSMACLYRTNAQSRALEEHLLTHRIPYVVIGGTNFYNRKEIKDVLGYIKIAAGRGDIDDVRRCINAPFRFLGKAFIDRIEPAHRSDQSWPTTVRRVAAMQGIQSRQQASALEWCSLIDTLSARMASTGPDASGKDWRKPAALIEEVLRVTDFIRWVTRDEGTESPENSRTSNIRELVRSCERFANVDELLDYVDLQVTAAKKAERNEDPNRVTLMSVHRSKGLEWPTVFVVGVNDKILPHARCEDVNEERRLAYVAFTRARDTLRVSCVATAAVGPRLASLEISQFIREAGIPVVEIGAAEPMAAE